MNRTLASTLVLTGLLSACATTPVGPVAPPPPPQAYAPPLPPAPELGGATLVGRLSPTPRRGANWSCGGESVVVLAASPATAERMQRLYGSTVEATALVDTVKRRATALTGLAPAEPPVTSTACTDPAGFRFSNLPGGEYYVIARARLKAGTAAAGASYALMHRVQLRPAETVVVTLGQAEAAAGTLRTARPRKPALPRPPRR